MVVPQHYYPSSHMVQVRFVESFHDQHGFLWLVFRYEGTALHSLMYTPLPASSLGEGEPTTQEDTHSLPVDSVQEGTEDGPADGAAGEEKTGEQEEHPQPLQVLQPSAWWWSMRRTRRATYLQLLQATLRALAAVHAANVTHR